MKFFCSFQFTVILFVAEIFCFLQKIGLYFSCELFPGVPKLCTDPDSKSCWQQAIYVLPEPLIVQSGQIVKIKCQIYKDRIICTLADKEISDKVCNLVSSESTSHLRTCYSNNEIQTSSKCENGLSNLYIEKSPTSIRCINNLDFLFLNDASIIPIFTCALGMDDIALSKIIVDITEIPNISLAILSMYPLCRLRCYYQHEEFLTILKTSQNFNRINFISHEGILFYDSS